MLSQIGILDPDFLRSVYGSMAETFTYSRGSSLFAHVSVALPVPGTPYRFADPWRGYYDPHVVDGNREFLHEALDRYGSWCRERGIIGELMRLSPIGSFRQEAASHAAAQVDTGQMVALLSLPETADAYLGALCSTARRNIRLASRHLTTACLDDPTADETLAVARAHGAALVRRRASSKWFLDLRDYDRLARLQCFDILAARDVEEDKIVAMTGVLYSGDTAQVLFVGSLANDRYKGACDLLYYRIVTRALERRARGQSLAWISFGGGLGTAEQDSLMRFKTKFSLGRKERCRYLVLRHDPDALEDLSRACRDTAEPRSDPSSQLKARHFPFLNSIEPVDARTLDLSYLDSCAAR